MMIEKIFLITHIVAGGSALIIGAGAAISRKGGKRHKAAGRVFAVCMLITGISALILSTMRPNAFLFGIGTFTLYLVSSGWVAVRQIAYDSKLKLIKGVGVFGILAAGYMLTQVLIGEFGSFAMTVYGVFGVFLLYFSLTDIFRPPMPAGLVRRHGGRMGGAYIAAITAFLVVNNTFLPPLVAWLLPTAIGTPLLVITLRKYQKHNTRP